MADTVALARRSQRTRTLRRRATAAGVGVLLGAFALVGVTTSLPADQTAPAMTAPSTAALRAGGQARPAAATTPAPRRIKTRQS
jgi:hypothetical protein